MLRKTGGDIYTWEWNALMDCAGKRWRKTSMTDYKAALDIFHDMNASLRLPSESISSRDDDDPGRVPRRPSRYGAPDIVTYTTLISIAGRTKQPFAIDHALKLLRTSGVESNRMTHLAILNCYAQIGETTGVRATVRGMNEQGVDVGIDGINTCLWVHARSGRMDVARMIYRVLRNNCVQPSSSSQVDLSTEEGEDEDEDEDIAGTVRYLCEVEHLQVPPGLMPDEVTYTTMIQCLAYQGELIEALNVFVDMLNRPNLGTGKPPQKSKRCRPSMAVFRAIFLGFYRHSRRTDGDAKSTTSIGSSVRSPWSLENLELVFVAFLDLPNEVKPSERVLYWILAAFGRTSGNAPDKLRQVWEQLENKYGGGWGGRLERTRKAIYCSAVGNEGGSCSIPLYRDRVHTLPFDE